MERYLGMDVHKASCTICVLSSTGKRIRCDVVETHGKALVGYLKQQPGRLHLILEECEWAHWLFEILSPHVHELVVVHGQRRVGAKNDSIDSWDLAERLRVGGVKRPIFKAPGFSKLRELSSVYTLVTRDVVQVKNRLKSRYRKRGIDCTGPSVYSPKLRVERIEELPAAVRPAVDLLGRSLDHLEELKAEAAAALVKESHRFEISRILETIPGLGPVRVAQILPVVVTPHRFRTKRQFWSYCGFGIVTRSSADWTQIHGQWVRSQGVMTRGLNQRANKTLKMVFKAAATTALHSKQRSRFHLTYERLCEEGTKPNLAKLTVARQIAATTLAVWKSKEAFDPNR